MQHKNELEQDSMLLSVLDALDAHAALLAGDGKILVVNKAWRRFAEDNGVSHGEDAVGMNYLKICENALRTPNSEGAAEVATAINSLLSGEETAQSIVLPCHSEDQERWYRFQGSRIKHDVAKVLVLHTNETERERGRRLVRDKFSEMSGRELEVLSLVIKGLSSASIAESLQISKNTVESHRRTIMIKAGASNSADLVRMAVLAEIGD